MEHECKLQKGEDAFQERVQGMDTIAEQLEKELGFKLAVELATVAK